jgi:C4-dicarboxylate-specific signal transduction histidine kinase
VVLTHAQTRCSGLSHAAWGMSMRDVDVLVVEDEAIVALHLRQQLTKLGYNVAGVASSGVEALRVATELQPAIVLMDINIDGDIDGIETASRLSTQLGPSIVYVSAYAEGPILERARSTSPYAYLVKPFSERELHATIQMTLERRRLDAELRAAKEIAQRERDSAQRHLEIATARHQRIQELQSEFGHAQRLTELSQVATTLIHEVLQPITAIKNYLGGLRRMEPSSELAEVLGRIDQQTNRTAEIIGRLRNYLRTPDLHIRPEFLSQIVAEAIALTTTMMTDFETTITVRLQPEEQEVEADKVLVQQVLVNLIRNSVEAVQNQSIRQISVTSKPTRDRMVEISIADTGVGISGSIRNKLFQAFVTTKPNGMGVGLSTCHRIVELHGGELWVEDGAEGGAVFRFTLKAIQA